MHGWYSKALDMLITKIIFHSTNLYHLLALVLTLDFRSVSGGHFNRKKFGYLKLLGQQTMFHDQTHTMVQQTEVPKSIAVKKLIIQVV